MAGSRINKARELLPPLVLSTVKSGAAVIVLPWNTDVKPEITFTPELFITDSGELLPDAEIAAQVVSATNDSVLHASGGTNIEAALIALCTKIRSLKSNHTGSVTVWFVTDGEESVYISDRGTNENIHMHQYFEKEQPDGTTAYQKKLIGIVDDFCKELSESSSSFSLDFHVCHFGEAHPIFLRRIREVTNGFFHAIKDLASIRNEMERKATATSTKLSLCFGAETLVVPAAVSDGALCCRGCLSDTAFDSFLAASKMHHTVRVFLPAPFSCEVALDKHITVSTSDKFRADLETLMGLERIFANVLNELTGEPLNAQKILDALTEVKQLRRQQHEALRAVLHARLLATGEGDVLLLFAEKVGASLDSQVDTLAALLGQYTSAATGEYDRKEMAHIELFNERDMQAIAAGLDSMKVRLGHGFITDTSLSQHVQRVMAARSAEARLMLVRQCRIAETERGSTTLLSLFILEGHEVKQAQAVLAERLASESGSEALALLYDTQTEQTFVETLTHGEAEEASLQNVVVCEELTLSHPCGKRVTLQFRASFTKMYPRVVAQCHCSVGTDDLREYCKHMMDPLSFSSFIELIREHNTLPSVLYTVAGSQTLGLLFDSKEFLYVVGGGKDLTSYSYFRLYWKLRAHPQAPPAAAATAVAEPTVSDCGAVAARPVAAPVPTCSAGGGTVSGEIQLPGSFHRGNSALPLAPDPLSALLLVHLLPGLLSEVITGTPMAPLPGIGNIYIGYLMMHMRAHPHTTLDVTRMAEIVSTVGQWLASSETEPTLEDVHRMADTAMASHMLAHADWPGKRMPVKAFAYLLLDERYHTSDKFAVLQHETLHRYARQIVVSGGPQRGADQRLAAQQLPAWRFFGNLFGAVAVDCQSLLQAAAELASLARSCDVRLTAEASAWLRKGARATELCRALRDVLVSRVGAAFEVHMAWGEVQRLLFVFFALERAAGGGWGRVSREFAKFGDITWFERDAKAALDVLDTRLRPLLSDCLCAWLEPNCGGSSYCYRCLCLAADDGARPRIVSWRGVDTNVEEAEAQLTTDAELAALWSAFCQVLRVWDWTKGSAETLFVLQPPKAPEAKVIAASGPAPTAAVAARKPQVVQVQGLSSEQLACAYANSRARKTTYVRFVARQQEEQPQQQTRQHLLADEHHHAVKQPPAPVDPAKHRISVAVLGSADCGKSTTFGHLIVDLGGIDSHTMETLMRDAASIKKGPCCYAWVLDRLREEREKCRTIIPHFWTLQTTNYHVDLLDGPGHREFLKNASICLAQADVGILCVSAAPNEFEAGIGKGGMTRELLAVSYTMGVGKYIVFVNKMDLVGWSESRFTEVSEGVLGLIKSVTGINPKCVPVVAGSGWRGDNLFKPYSGTDAEWYNGWRCVSATSAGGDDVILTGRTLMDAVSGMDPPLRNRDGPLRIPVTNVHKMEGAGIVAVGRVVCERIPQNDHKLKTYLTQIQ
eukprot:TRINITY_DN771_c1_g1_i4.p1 TRINITY_DN771_c1_g1~~TRINITY_DN771_c1_g1_i4.p1  ORF type:complete len:1535 (-),score=344.89 TRINITY_DN771_c1_g1_i4:764-5137(-)